MSIISHAVRSFPAPPHSIDYRCWLSSTPTLLLFPQAPESDKSTPQHDKHTSFADPIFDMFYFSEDLSHAANHAFFVLMQWVPFKIPFQPTTRTLNCHHQLSLFYKPTTVHLLAPVCYGALCVFDVSNLCPFKIHRRKCLCTYTQTKTTHVSVNTLDRKPTMRSPLRKPPLQSPTAKRARASSRLTASPSS